MADQGKGCFMQRCESNRGGGCTSPATWEQNVHAGGRATGRVEYSSYWCDTHAEAIAEKRRTNWNVAATMTRLSEDAVRPDADHAGESGR
jgi:hypothetical protein